MKSFEALVVEISEGIASVMINRPKALNALNRTVFSELKECFETLSTEAIIGVIVYGSGEKSFVAGADITEFSGLNAETGSQLSKRGHDILNLIENFPKPVIAVIQGYALGGGFELALACHIRIAEEKARFGLPEVGLGLIPGYGGTQRLKELCGRAKAIEMTITGDMIGAEEAVNLRIANHKVPQGEGINKANEILKKVATKGPLAISTALKAIHSNSFQAEIAFFGELLATSDAKEGAAAFLEKRSPNFTRE